MTNMKRGVNIASMPEDNVDTRGTNKLAIRPTTAATEGPSLPDFGIGICEPASCSSEGGHDRALSPLDSTSSPTSGSTLTAKLSAESSFSKHVLDDNGGNWRQTVSAAFKLIDHQGHGVINAELLLLAMDKFELVRSILPDFPLESNRRIDVAKAFIRLVGGGEVVNEAAWTSRFCIDIPFHKRPPIPPRFNATAFGQTTAFILDLDGSSLLSTRFSGGRRL